MRGRIAIVLMFGGSAAIIWCLTVLGSAALYQWYEGRRIMQMAHHAPLPIVEAPPAPRLHQVIGRLDIPRLHLSTVVIEGDDGHALRLGAGHVPGTALPYEAGNVGIAAHRDTFFRPLKSITPNDRITLTTPEGEFDYVVQSTEIVRPTAVSVLEATKQPELTLVTCYPFYYIGSAPLRFIVHARLIGPPGRAGRGLAPLASRQAGL